MTSITLFVTGEVARPIGPPMRSRPGEVRELQAAHAGFAAIAHDLRVTDVHPPLYFWLAAVWRSVVGNGLFAFTACLNPVQHCDIVRCGWLVIGFPQFRRCWQCC